MSECRKDRGFPISKEVEVRHEAVAQAVEIYGSAGNEMARALIEYAVNLRKAEWNDRCRCDQCVSEKVLGNLLGEK